MHHTNPNMVGVEPDYASVLSEIKLPVNSHLSLHAILLGTVAGRNTQQSVATCYCTKLLDVIYK